ncbi:hypothetical protein BBO_06863 [Beauveria brongniartii RCEF 3172]|uniref:Uncharacterized protein n=1 Tax=Beauveria brongniartii RCEF 3172 TaxID=1081107 RepID=A0A167AKH5_9HYPO|nr:hypothetical protein BBO_06863 [Beauveria brongniartii RCEF 3172]
MKSLESDDDDDDDDDEFWCAAPTLTPRASSTFCPGGNDPENLRSWSGPRAVVQLLRGAIFLALSTAPWPRASPQAVSTPSPPLSTSLPSRPISQRTLFVAGNCGGARYSFAHAVRSFYGPFGGSYTGAFLESNSSLPCESAPLRRHFWRALLRRPLPRRTCSCPSPVWRRAPASLLIYWDAADPGQTSWFVFCVLPCGRGISLGTVGAVAARRRPGAPWRWAFYFALVVGAAAVVVMVTRPETLATAILKQKAKRHRESIRSGQGYLEDGGGGGRGVAAGDV